MKPAFATLLFVVVSFFCSYAVDKPAAPVLLSPQEQKGAQYIAGVMLLSRTIGLSDTVRGAWYKRLEAVTGFTATSYKTFEMRYANDPAGWERLISAAQKTLSQP